MDARLPKVLMTDVVRSSHHGDSHGGVYLVDLESEGVEKKLDWNTCEIAWEGRGGDRGLRGIAFWRGMIVIAASDEVFFFDLSFRLVRSLRNRYLSLCHEILIEGDRLFLTSTGFDSVLECDLQAERFVNGICLRAKGAGSQAPIDSPEHLELRRFDPESSEGPSRADTIHLNSIAREDGMTLASGTRFPWIMAIDHEEGGLPHAHLYARIPVWTHNARPYRDGTIYNSTSVDQVCHASRDGTVRAAIDIFKHDPTTLTHAELPCTVARPNFGRGLAVWPDDPEGTGVVIAGSSPSTVSVYDIDRAERVRTITFGRDIRNAPHGLAVWPYD